MKLTELLGDYPGLKGPLPEVPEIGSLCYDSRKAEEGALFFCVKGYETDGHRYAVSACEKGAVALICHEQTDADLPHIFVDDCRKALAYASDRFYGHPSGKLKVIGVTGTNGKTTATYLVKQILETAGYRVGLMGTNQNMIGDRVLPSEHTTPDSLELQQFLAQMAEEGAEYVVMEVSSHSLELSRVASTHFAVAAFSNLTRDHLDFHNGMEGYFAAKAKLFSMCDIAVINADDEYGRRLIGQCPSISYGIDREADLRATGLSLEIGGSEFELEYRGETMPIHLCTIGKFSVYNGLCAAGIALACGIAPETIRRGLEQMKGVCGRAEVLELPTPYHVVIDYAHTPDGLVNIITALRTVARGRIVTLFGCGGDRDRGKRALMGEAAGKLSDVCIVTSDNPRTEQPDRIIADILPGIEPTGCAYTVIENRREAIGYALEHAQENDVILLAGKGHETYQILGKEKIRFDEREVVREWLERSNV